MRMELTPIGKVCQVTQDTSVLEIEPDLTEGLEDVKAGDRLQVLYWMHELPETSRGILKVHPRGDKSRPLTGVFSVRSPMRPNPIGVTVVTVARKEGNQIWIEGLDAIVGSPVIDIKGSPK